ncbi:hypothetical protein THAOC_29123, partial [Thalassiosira oceanica]
MKKEGIRGIPRNSEGMSNLEPGPAQEERGEAPDSAAVGRTGGVATAVAVGQAGGLIIPRQDDPVHEEERSDAVPQFLEETEPCPSPPYDGAMPPLPAGGRVAAKMLVDGLTDDVGLAQIKEAALHLEEILYKALFIVEEVPEQEWKEKSQRLKRNFTGLGVGQDDAPRLGQASKSSKSPFATLTSTYLTYGNGDLEDLLACPSLVASSCPTLGGRKKYRDSIHSKAGNPGKAFRTLLIPKAEYDKLEDASRRPSDNKRKQSTGGSSDGPTKMSKTTSISSKPASPKSKQGSTKPAKDEPRSAKPTKAKPASSRSAALVKPASQSLSKK